MYHNSPYSPVQIFLTCSHSRLGSSRLSSKLFGKNKFGFGIVNYLFLIIFEIFSCKYVRQMPSANANWTFSSGALDSPGLPWAICQLLGGLTSIGQLTSIWVSDVNRAIDVTLGHWRQSGPMALLDGTIRPLGAHKDRLSGGHPRSVYKIVYKLDTQTVLVNFWNNITLIGLNPP